MLVANKELSVIIVNYNGAHYLTDCFASIKKHLNCLDYEIIVVDNASTDDSLNLIKSDFPEVILIESKENLGFGKANNLGVSYAKAPTLLLLNNDTVLLNNLQPAIQQLYADSHIGIIAINMLNSDKKYLSAVGKFPRPLNLIKLSLLNDTRAEFKTGKFFDKNYKVNWVCGAFMLLRKSDFELVQGFDKDYFMYVEDVDICKKLQNHGKQCVFMPQLHYIHHVGFNKSREFLLIKGFKIYAKKHFSVLGYGIALALLGINKWVKILKYQL